PSRERASVTRPSGRSFPWFTRSSIRVCDRAGTSTVSPLSMPVLIAVGGPNTGASACPLACSKASASSVMTALSPPELISLIGSRATGLPPETWRNHSGRAALSPLALTRVAAFAAAPSQPVLHERADARERGARFRQHAHQQMPDVPHARRDLELHVAAGGAHFLGHPRGIVAQHVVAADLDERRRQAARVAVERRRVRVTRIGAGEEKLDHTRRELDRDERV